MDKQEFVDKLRMALTGRVAPELVAENVNYYEDYINTQIRMGKSELMVLEELGDPRLIAKTIIDTHGQPEVSGAEYQENAYRSSDYQEERGAQTGPTIRGIQLPRWLWIVIVSIGVILLISVVFSILSFLAPFIIVMLVVVFLVKLFRDWLN